MIAHQRREEYSAALVQYLKENREECLYRLYELSKSFMDEGLGPGDILALHIESMEQILAGDSLLLRPAAVFRTFRAFLEVISPYEMAFGHYAELKKLSLLQEVSMELISFLDMDSLCRYIVDKTSELLRMEEGYLFLKNKATGEMELAVAKSIQIENLKKSAGENFPVRIPLKADKLLVGEIRLGGRKGFPPDEVEKRMISILANQFALALERLKLYKIMEEQSTTDGLTGVYNRRHFYEILAKEIHRVRRYRQKLSLMMIDIDDFKEINDCYGHLVGDAIIKNITEILKDTVRETDVVARYGGDEFVILMPDTDKKQAVNAAVRILNEIRGRKFEVDAVSLGVTLSAGVADYSVKDMSESDLLKRADEALYRAKGEGKNRVCLHDEVALWISS
ncbi:MAG: diguanylate cyclase [Peptococcaceae bacterium]|nr:MAG: diguanylate cyclase [Peptococcaceae bacterium]